MRTRVVSVIALCAALLAPGVANADADPASDVLYTGSLFLPYEAKPSPGVEAELSAAIEHAAAAGKPIRVALIAAPRDLGGVPQLFGRPVEYARFLDAELQFVYSGRLLVVMPQGAGYAKGGHLIADKAVDAARPGPGGDGLAKTATELVQALSGAKATSTTTTASSSAKGSSWWVAAVIAVAALAVLVAALVLILRRRR